MRVLRLFAAVESVIGLARADRLWHARVGVVDVLGVTDSLDRGDLGGHEVEVWPGGLNGILTATAVKVGCICAVNIASTTA